jgi:hypothetical protein
MAFTVEILLAILGAAGLGWISWRGMKSSDAITNPFPELPEDAFRKCADLVKKRYSFFLASSLVILVSILLLSAVWAGWGGYAYLFGVLGIFIGLFFCALGVFERRKVEEILEAHKHDWYEFTKAVAAHKA